MNSIAPTKKVRDSNFELFRIFLMLMIIAHHYVTGSGIGGIVDSIEGLGTRTFYNLFAWGGKTGINCFLLITGFFMCRQRFSPKKLLKLVLEIKFYRLVIFLIFVATGYSAFSFEELFKVMFTIFYNLNMGFAGAFVALYVMIPFINTMLDHLNRSRHLALVLVLLLIYTVSSTFFLNFGFEYLGWYITVYVIGAFIRKYPVSFFTSRKLAIIMSVVFTLAAWASMIAIDIIRPSVFFTDRNFFIADSNKLLAICCAVSFFLVFKNISLKPSKLINTVAASTFGILLIHTSSSTMLTFLWEDLLHTKSFIGSPLMPLHAIGSVLGVYIVCFAIDYLRIRFIEKPFFSMVDRHWSAWETSYYIKKNCLRSYVKRIADKIS